MRTTAIVRTILLTLILSAVTAGGSVAQTGAGQDATTKTLQVIGSALVVKNDVAAAKEQALANSFVAAVNRVAAELVTDEAVVNHFTLLNEKIFGQTDQYIETYQVLTEAVSGKSYRVLVQATVAVDKMSRRLKYYKILQESRVQLPKVLFLIAEKNVYDFAMQYWWGGTGYFSFPISESIMAEELSKQGLRVIDHRMGADMNLAGIGADTAELTDEQALALAAQFKAQVVVVGLATAQLAPNIMGEEMRSFKGTVAARVLRVDTGEQIAALFETKVTASGDDFTGSRDAMTGAAVAAGQDAAAQITDAWQRAAQQTAMIEIVVQGTSALIHFVKLRRAVDEISGVKDLQTREMKSNVTTLVAEYKGSPRELANALMLKSFDGFGINIQEVTPDRLTIGLIPNP